MHPTMAQSMSDIELWLKNIGLAKYVEVFARHDIDLDVAPSLSEQDLEKLGLSLGHRRRFLTAAAKLRADGAQTTDDPTQADAPRPEATRVERRQVTVVFSDLVGSTALASQLDPEDMGRLLQENRNVCAAVVSRYDGHVAQYLGDGIVAYFGYPAAQEHAAERAVASGAGNCRRCQPPETPRRRGAAVSRRHRDRTGGRRHCRRPGRADRGRRHAEPRIEASVVRRAWLRAGRPVNASADGGFLRVPVCRQA